MLNRKIQYNKQDLTLFKGRNQYDKVMKEMNEAPKEYETIKALVEEKNNNITNVQNNYFNKQSKNNIQMKSHNKIKKIENIYFKIYKLWTIQLASQVTK